MKKNYVLLGVVGAVLFANAANAFTKYVVNENQYIKIERICDSPIAVIVTDKETGVQYIGTGGSYCPRYNPNGTLHLADQ